ncbi:MAG: hypothetical protein FWD68_13950 [Alphaproteobacteria bacterium]|nr:hypothetical protein [Alphaproteobacteria bacterium]
MRIAGKPGWPLPMEQTALSSDDPDFDEALSQAFDKLKNTAVSDHFKAGRPVYYRERHTPQNHVIKEYPNGRRELLDANDNVVAVLDPA